MDKRSSKGGARLLDREGLLCALDALSKRLGERGVRARVHVAGSGAMLLGHGRTRATQDLDALSIDHRETVLAAAREIAAEQGLSEEWINDDVRDLYFRMSVSLAGGAPAVTLYDSPSLIVTGVSASQLLAMKAQACRDEDLDDIAVLLGQLSVTTMDEIREAHSAVFPHDILSARKEERLRAVLRQVLGEGSADQRVGFRAPRRSFVDSDCS